MEDKNKLQEEIIKADLRNDEKMWKSLDEACTLNSFLEKMTKDELSMVGFEIVAYSGDARSTLLELLKEMRAGNFDNVEEKLKEADENINLAHQSQTTILQQEARGEDMEMGFIFIHGQDHLMTTILLRDVIEDFITLYRERGTK